MTTLRLLPSSCEDLFSCMAADEAIFREAIRTNVSRPVLRFYRFKTSSVSVGFSQRQAEFLESIASKSLPWVRRPTGGGTVFHDGDFVLSLVFRSDFGPGYQTARESYRAIHGLIRHALLELDIETDFFSESLGAKEARQDRMVCFKQPVRNDLVQGPKKIAGGAQRRCGVHVLHQGSILVDSNSCNTNELEKIITSEFCREFHASACYEEWIPEETAQKNFLRETKYKNFDWNWFGKKTVEWRPEADRVCTCTV